MVDRPMPAVRYTRVFVKYCNNSMVAISSLPPLFSGGGVSSIRWPLGDNSCPPLFFQPLEELKADRNPKGLAAIGKGVLSDLSGAVESMFPPGDGNDEKRHFGLCSVALVLLGNGYTDECHDLITPLSWPEDTYFGHGPSVYSRVSPEAQAFASYVHSLVHRREAFHTGEFGMVGFANANYWSNAVLQKRKRASSSSSQRGGNKLLDDVRLRDEIHKLVTLDCYKDCSLAHEWCQRHAFVLLPLDDDNDNNADNFGCLNAIHELCATVLRKGRGCDPLFRDFAERVAETEVRVLLGHALNKAGYPVDVGSIVAERSP